MSRAYCAERHDVIGCVCREPDGHPGAHAWSDEHHSIAWPRAADLDAYRENRPTWAASRARCGACGHAWVYVWDTADGEDYGWLCPGCGRRTGVEASRVERGKA